MHETCILQRSSVCIPLRRLIFQQIELVPAILSMGPSHHVVVRLVVDGSQLHPPRRPVDQVCELTYGAHFRHLTVLQLDVEFLFQLHHRLQSVQRVRLGLELGQKRRSRDLGGVRGRLLDDEPDDLLHHLLIRPALTLFGIRRNRLRFGLGLGLRLRLRLGSRASGHEPGPWLKGWREPEALPREQRPPTPPQHKGHRNAQRRQQWRGTWRRGGCRDSSSCRRCRRNDHGCPATRGRRPRTPTTTSPPAVSTPNMTPT
mmetsp:Transcript_8294/g.22902  ORF Transcript_8294/g.22902 Transcript_8294/m.22902 type:complete len:258 (+) Transcript_8294:60-833(+)